MIHDDEDQKRLYSISIIRSFVEYIEKYYQDIDVDEILQFTRLTRSELADDGYWCTQPQVERFHSITVKLTGNPDIAREAGRYTVSNKAYRIIRQYVFGFISPSTAYMLSPKISSMLSKGATVTTKLFGDNRIEMISKPAPGVHEKEFQCQNRLGHIEALAAAFTGEYAAVEHPSCFHKGDEACRYIISWKEPLFLKFSKFRNILLFFGLMICGALSFFLPHTYNAVLLSILFMMVVSITILGLYFEKDNYQKQVADHAQTAELLMQETNIRSNDARLIQEIGQAISSVLDTDMLIKKIMEIIRQGLDFDRGAVLLANTEKTLLQYKACYGFTPDQEEFFVKNDFCLNDSKSEGPFVGTFKEMKLQVLKNKTKTDDMARQWKDLLLLSDANSFICVPIVFENQGIGVLYVDRIKSLSPITQSDLDKIMGIAPQIAISINNARTYEKIEANEERYRSILNEMDEAYGEVDLKGSFTFLNESMCETLGYSRVELIGMNNRVYTSPENARKALLTFNEIYRTGIPKAIMDYEIIRKNGEKRILETSILPIKKLSGEIIGFRCVSRDVTERIKAEEAQRILEERLQQADKMEAIGTLAGGIAHDFNNLLMGIQGYASMTLLNLDPTNPNYERLKRIEQQVQSGADLTSQLLGFARGGRYEVKPTDMNEIIQKTSSMFGRTKKEISINRKTAKDLWNVEVDRGQMEQVFLNLYVNAWQAMPGGGEIYLETDNVLLNDEQVFPYTIKPGKYVKITITDTGTGMDEKTQVRIFDPFFTTKEMGRGTGLGLATVYGIIKGHHGIINVYSETGHGTTFTIYLPASEKEILKEETLKDEIARGTETILLIDDEQMVMEVNQELLESIGYKVYVAGSGQEGIAVYMEKKDKIDLVILDMVMPGISGSETFDRLREINSNIKVLLSSGYSLNGEAKHIMDRGCNGFLQKPFRLEELSGKVRAMLG